MEADCPCAWVDLVDGQKIRVRKRQRRRGASEESIDQEIADHVKLFQGNGVRITDKNLRACGFGGRAVTRFLKNL
jgi:hypothetical protein